ncbi:MAG: hypothetical protein H6553_08760 [Chitinophagales bacterium]|nr:hypothetical protein [Chitinophagales bacterium]
MKKNLFILAILAVFSTVFITSCSPDEDKYACSIDEYVGTYYGQHSLTVSSVAVPIKDTIIISAVSGTDSIDITSKTLNKTFRGIISNCDIFVDDASVNTFSISTPLGTATVSNVVADLRADYNLTKGNLTTTISVSQGTATLGSANLSISGEELTGTFKK